jgi:hypothetical protein
VDDHFARSGRTEKGGNTLFVAPAVHVQIGHELVETHPPDGEHFDAARLPDCGSEFLGGFRRETSSHELYINRQ